jgi:Fic family protein
MADARDSLIDAAYVPIRGFDWMASCDPGNDWEQELLALNGAMQASGSPSALASALGVVLRLAATETGAVEDLYDLPVGVTLSVAYRDEEWRELLGQVSPDAVPHVEAQLATYAHVLAESRTSALVGEAWIRNIHVEITRGQETYEVQTSIGARPAPLPKGEYKRHPNHVRLRSGETHAYCPVDDTAAEMHRLVQELDLAAFREASPILQAAYVHWALTHIHPFADGNGRVARAVASYFLLKGANLPVVISRDRKASYLQALEWADAGEPQQLVDYFAIRAVDTSRWLMELINEATEPKVERQLEELTRLANTYNSVQLESIDSCALRVHEALFAFLAELSIGPAWPLPEPIEAASSHETAYLPNTAGQQREIDLERLTPAERQARGSKMDLMNNFKLGIHARVRVLEPANVDKYVNFTIWIHDNAPFAISVASSGPVPPLSLRREDVSPSISLGAEARLRLFVRRCIAHVLQAVTSSIKGTLNDHGALAIPQTSGDEG